MKIFLIKITSLSFVLLGIIYGVDYFIWEGIKKSSYREISKWNEVIEGGIDAEILIVGSSRALVHFDPRIIEEKTGMTCYNLGLDGSKYEAQRKVLELYLEKNEKPKILIWSLDFGSFEEVEGIYRYEQFIPFWSESKVKEILSLNKRMELEYLDFPIIRYSNNSAIKYRGILSWFSLKLWEPNLVKGYRVTREKRNGELMKIDSFPDGVISIGFNKELFLDFLKLTKDLKENDIETKWIVSPYFEAAFNAIINRQDFIKLLSQESSNLEVEFIDYSFSEISLHEENFYNGSHLSLQGVRSFIEKIY